MMKLKHTLAFTAIFMVGMLFSDFASATTKYVVASTFPAASCTLGIVPRHGLNDLGWVAVDNMVYNMTAPGSVTTFAPAGALGAPCAVSINNTGQVVGNYSGVAFMTGPNATGISTPLSGPTAPIFGLGSPIKDVVTTTAVAINNSGQLLVDAVDVDGIESTVLTRTDGLIIASRYANTPFGLNNDGQVIYFGLSSIYYFTGNNGVGSFQVPQCGNFFGGINDSGQVVCSSAFTLFITGSGGVGQTNLGTSVQIINPLAVNNAGQVVGFFADGLFAANGTAFVTTATGITDLNTLVNLPGVNLVIAEAINNAGQILAEDNTGLFYLLNPVAAVAGPDVDKNNGCPCNSAGTPFPINAGTGNKYFSDTDYVSPIAGGLSFQRQYNSQESVAGKLGVAWRHNYGNAIGNGVVNNVAVTIVTRPDGRSTRFIGSSGVYTAQDPDVTDQLVQLPGATGWAYTVAADDSVETYDATGKLQSIKARSGLTQTLTYSTSATPISIAPSANLLITVTDGFGRQLNFTYDGNARIKSMSDPSGALYGYAYDSNNNLAAITYPDESIKTYHYDEAPNVAIDLPNALTGITDENSNRYANYYYDNQGRAYLENHGGTVDQYQVTYGTSNTSTITDPLGTARVYGLQTVLGVVKSTGVTQPDSSGTTTVSNSKTFDANGNLFVYTDFNGNVTKYTSYDLTRNLETSRIEAYGTPLARTITTTWNPTYHLPAIITEPGRVTTYGYDNSNGNLLTKTITAGTKSRIWTYTYNGAGQIASVTGPRTDVKDITKYTYDPSGNGNLISMTNALQQVTAFTDYDNNGRVGLITDPNGATTALTYYPRGWLKSKGVTVGPLGAAGSFVQTTSYEYYATGQLKMVTLPDNSTLSYTYDNAHRLTNIQDNLGDSITYTPDDIGNRIGESVNDPSGLLTAQITRVYNSLNLLEQVTGAAQ